MLARGVGRRYPNKNPAGGSVPAGIYHEHAMRGDCYADARWRGKRGGTEMGCPQPPRVARSRGFPSEVGGPKSFWRQWR